MGILDRLRRSPAANQLRTGPTLAVPATAGTSWVEHHALQWSPGATRGEDGSLLVSPTLRLVGPIGHDEALWRAAEMPPGSAAGYVAAGTGRAATSDLTRYDLTAGLCRRLGGWWRGKAGAEWQSLHELPPDPVVYAATELPVAEAVRLLAPHLPDLRVKESDEDGYELDCATGSVEVDYWPPDDSGVCPLVRMQPWYGSATRIAHYALYAQVPETDEHDARHRIGQAARALADATAGLLLDQDGFPWPEPKDGGA